MKIGVIGAGYVGLVTSACLADKGNDVMVVENDHIKMDSILGGELPIFEQDLDGIIESNINKNLFFSTKIQDLADREIIFICVGTPESQDGSSDLSAYMNVLNQLTKILHNQILLIIKSTVPVGTAKKTKNFLKNQGFPSKNVFNNPEFLREGSAVYDFNNPDRIVIGAEHSSNKDLLSNLFKPFIEESKIVFTSNETAELAKYASNSFLATKISFINEIAQISDAADCNIKDVSKIMGLDKRIGDQFLNSGIGFGGSCFPKDLTALKSMQLDLGLESSIIDAALKVNNNQITFFLKKIFDELGDSAPSSLHFWGATFKAGTNDMRNSQSIKVISQLAKKIKNIYLYDPFADEAIKNDLKIFNNIVVLKDKYSKLEESDGIVIGTDWEEFKDIDFTRIVNSGIKNIFDGRNLFSKNDFQNVPVNYIGIGS